MKKVLEPLSRVPGVRRAMLISMDGVPIVSATNRAVRSDGDGSNWHDSADDLNAFAGLALGWLADVQRAVDPMSWNVPTRLVLRAARGTLILLLGERAMLSVELERGMGAEELRLPMEAALARLQRTLRRGGRDTAQPATGTPAPPVALAHPEEISGIFPGPEGAPVDGGLPSGANTAPVSIETARPAGEKMRGTGFANESNPAAGQGLNDATGNEVP